MGKYMVERDLPGITSAQLVAAAGSAKRVSQQMTTEGTPVRYLRSTFVPKESKCFCLFEGTSVDAVRQVQERGKIPFTRIHEANFITAEDV